MTRKDFLPLIKGAVRAAHLSASQHARTISKSKLIQYLCPIYTEIDQLALVAVHFVQAFINANHTNQYQLELEELVTDEIAKTFRMPVKASAKAVTDVLANYLSSSPTLRYSHDCTKKLNSTHSIEAIRSATGVLAALSYGDTMHELKLGQLMTIATWQKSTKMPSVYQKDLQTDTQKSLIQWLKTLIPQLQGDDTKFTISQLMEYVANSQSEKYQDESIPCHVNKELYKTNPHHNSSNTFCMFDPNSPCCKLEKELSKQREAIMRIMKYTYAPASRLLDEKSQSNEARKYAESLKYKLRSGDNFNSDPVVVACKFGNEPLTPNCSKFSMLYNTGGIGYTFNNKPFWSLYRNTSENYAFYKEFYEKNNGAEGISQGHVASIVNEFSLTFIVKHSRASSLPSKIRMVMNNPMDVPDLSSDYFILDPGMAYYIYLTPTQTVTDRGGLKLKLSQRKCLSASENKKLKIFKAYTQSACIFECKLRRAVSECNCSPWDYPVLDRETPICTARNGKPCFEEVMAAPFDIQECGCPNDCSFVQYSKSPLIHPILPISGFCDNLDLFEKR